MMQTKCQKSKLFHDTIVEKSNYHNLNKSRHRSTGTLTLLVKAAAYFNSLENIVLRLTTLKLLGYSPAREVSLINSEGI